MGVKVRWNDRAAQFYLYVNHRKQRKAYPTGIRTQTKAGARQAEKLADEKRGQLARQGIGLPEPVAAAPTLAAYLVQWIDASATRCKTTTLDGYRREIAEHIVPVLGRRRVDTLTKADCLEMIHHWARTGLRTESLRLMLAVLRAALTDATAYLPVNPALNLRKECRQPNEIKHEWRPYTRDEANRLLQCAEAAGPHSYPVCLLGLRAGLRLGEIIALQWGDLDFAGLRIAVQRSQNQKRIVTSPKRGRRYVDMSDRIAEYFQSLPRPTDPTTFVCTAEDGSAYYQLAASRVFHDARRAAGLRHVRVHDMRHTFASQLLELGVPLHYVSKQLGHASIEITANTYAHLVPGANREWVNRLTPGSPA